MQSAGLVLLGRISGAQGLKGEVRITAFTERPENIAAYGVLVDGAGRRYVLEALRLIKGNVVAATLPGIGDRNAADALKGVELYVAKSRLPQPDADEWYYGDLIGLTAVDAEGAEVGAVVAIQNYGAGDLLEIRLTGRRKTVYVPFSESCVPKVDVMAGRVVVVMPEETDEQPGA